MDDGAERDFKAGFNEGPAFFFSQPFAELLQADTPKKGLHLMLKGSLLIR